jgi:acyl carrier protein
VASALGVPQDSLTTATSADDIEPWDSLGHLQLIMEIEQRFDVRFHIDQIPNLTSLVAIEDALRSKGAL